MVYWQNNFDGISKCQFVNCDVLIKHFSVWLFLGLKSYMKCLCDWVIIDIGKFGSGMGRCFIDFYSGDFFFLIPFPPPLKIFVHRGLKVQEYTKTEEPIWTDVVIDFCDDANIVVDPVVLEGFVQPDTAALPQ